MSIKIPSDSALIEWMASMEVTEVPTSYQIAMGVAAIGAILRRMVWYNQIKWRVYPNVSVLVIGPSGIGKDVVINQTEAVVTEAGGPPVVVGRTMEQIYARLVELGDPACAIIPAQEISSFVGQKDYQKGMVQDITDLLSTGDYKDVSIKGEPNRKIMRPTITMLAGSTPEWLHKAMPEGALEGGLFPRFLVVCEEYGGKAIPLVAWDNDRAVVERAILGRSRFVEFLKELPEQYGCVGSMPLLEDAREMYGEWYRHRWSMFSPAVAPYANRSRDQVLRIALVCAVSRGKKYIEDVDVQFGIDVLGMVAESIDRAVVPPTLEAQIGEHILRMLPATNAKIYKTLGRQYNSRMIKDALGMLVMAGRATPGERWTKNSTGNKTEQENNG